MLDVRELREGRNLEGLMSRNYGILRGALPFSFVRGANDSGHLVLQYEKTTKENNPIVVDSTSWVVNQGPSYLTGRYQYRSVSTEEKNTAVCALVGGEPGGGPPPGPPSPSSEPSSSE